MSRGTAAAGAPREGGTSNIRRVDSLIPAAQRQAVKPRTAAPTIQVTVKGWVVSSMDTGIRPPCPEFSSPGTDCCTASIARSRNSESEPSQRPMTAKPITSTATEAKSML